jgi:hypothetical protein
MLARFESIRRRLQALRMALLSPSPEEIVNCMPALEQAIPSGPELELELPDDRDPQARLEIRIALHALQSDLQIARRLIERSAALHQGWATLLAAAVGGYVASGAPTPLTAAGTVSLEG